MTKPRSAAALLAALFLLLPAYAGSNLPATPSASPSAQPAVPENLAAFIQTHYAKSIHRIPMRDGVKLFTIVYSPKDTARTYPFLMIRTPYGVAPYAENEFPAKLGPNALFAEEGYVFVYQDVRGKYMSEGEFEDVRPCLDHKQKPTDIDETSDTYDTIEYLLKHVPNHNGRAGLWGISYPGFYVSAGVIDAHPAIKAASPQAPVTDWFFDDFHHHGASDPSAFIWFSSFGHPRPVPTTQKAPHVEIGTPDGYQFFLDLGTLKNVEPRHLHHEIKFWTQLTEHPNYDAFWQARNILPHLRHVAPAMLVVGGWFDAEDLYGTLNTYQAVKKQNPGVAYTLVMGPWRHDGWMKDPGNRLGDIEFGSKTSEFYQRNIELAFFNHYLKDKPDPKLPEAYLFETGADQWRKFGHWPPAEAREKSLYLQPGGALSWEPPSTSVADSANPDGVAFDSFISDPAKPVPFTQAITSGAPPAYMTEDQRFAARRPDVLVYQTPPLTNNLTLAGPIMADLWVSTTAGDADWIVKLVDVYPPDAKDYPNMTPGKRLGGYQMLVRSEVIRGRFRNSNTHPEPFTPNEPTRVQLPIQDVLHTFLPGHRLMVQIQSTWFPLFDRNPQKYVDNIFQANESDFIKATHRVYHAAPNATRLRLGVLE